MFYFFNFSLPISFLMIVTIFAHSSAHASTQVTNNNKPQTEKKILLSGMINFEPPSESGDPNSTAAGGSRSSCPQHQATLTESVLPLTALLPKTTNQWLTIKQRPTLFVYVPPTSASTILFQLKDNQDEIIYQNLIPISTSTGKIVDITIPENAPSLNIQQEYQWSVFLLCQYHSPQAKNDPTLLQEYYDLMNEPWVMGSITRIQTPTTFNQQLENNLSLDLAIAYAERGLWFETLATLHQMITKQPQESQLIELWQDLLESQGLETQITQTQLSQ